MSKLTKKELTEKVKALGDITEDQRNRVVCSLIGHSAIISMCFGYVHCGRCDEQIGDRLAGVFDTTDSVFVGHNCETCRKNYKALGWKDKIYVPNPLKPAKAVK